MREITNYYILIVNNINFTSQYNKLGILVYVRVFAEFADTVYYKIYTMDQNVQIYRFMKCVYLLNFIL